MHALTSIRIDFVSEVTVTMANDAISGAVRAYSCIHIPFVNAVGFINDNCSEPMLVDRAQ